MKLILDDVDISLYVKDEGERVEYKKIHGNHEGIVLSGKEIEEILSIKFNAEYECEYLTWEQIKVIVGICSKDKVTCTCYDPREGVEKTIIVKPSMSSATKELEINGNTYWGGITITINED